MVVRIASMVLRICGVLALILGILFWAGTADALVSIHMLLGILVTLSLWTLGGVILTVRGGAVLGIIAIVLGLCLVALGLSQENLLNNAGDPHWIIQVLHLLLGLAAIALGEVISARYKRSVKATTQQSASRV